MDGSKAHAVPTGLEPVRRRLERWRRAPPNPFADSRLAVGCRGESGRQVWDSSNFRALRLDYYSLKERVEQQSTAISAPATKDIGGQGEPPLAAFLELAPPASIGSCECTLELENAAGAKIASI